MAKADLGKALLAASYYESIGNTEKAERAESIVLKHMVENRGSRHISRILNVSRIEKDLLYPIKVKK